MARRTIQRDVTFPSGGSTAHRPLDIVVNACAQKHLHRKGSWTNSEGQSHHTILIETCLTSIFNSVNCENHERAVKTGQTRLNMVRHE